MTKRISVALVASVVVVIVGAPIAGANPVSTQYDEPSVTQPPVTESVTPPPVTEAVTQPPVTPPVTEAVTPPVTEAVTPPVTEAVTPPVTKATAASNTVNTSNPTTAPAEVTTVASGGGLPYTGLDLGVFLMIGGVAVASGLGLRRVAARRSLDR